MEGIGGRWSLLIFLVCCRPSSTSNNPESLCPKPAPPQDAILVMLHSDVNLTCGGCEGSVSWRRRSPPETPRRLEVTEGGHLVLESVTYEDEDRYSCYKDGAHVCSVELMVKDELRGSSRLRCYHRYPTHNITCEWTPPGLLHPSSNATLIVFRALRGPIFYPCTYSRGMFTCLSHYMEGDTRRHAFYLCVSSRTDSALTASLDAKVKDLLHVGPPLDVRVTPVQDQPRKLQVTWERPPFWDDTFYHLKYQILYHVEHSAHPSNETTKARSFIIDDAVMGRKHLIRVRAREEFQENWGSWSEEVAGFPWSEATTAWVPTEYSSLASEETPNYEDWVPPEDAVSSPRLFWIAPCVCLGLLLVFLFGVWIRYQETRVLKLHWGFVRSLFHSSSTAKTARPPGNETPLMSPPPVTVTVPPQLGEE